MNWKYTKSQQQAEELRGEENKVYLAGLGEAGSEIILVDPVLQISNPKGSYFFKRLRMVIPSLLLRRHHHRHRLFLIPLAAKM